MNTVEVVMAWKISLKARIRHFYDVLNGRRNSDLPLNQPIVIQISLERNEMELSIKYISFPRNTHSASNLI